MLDVFGRVPWPITTLDLENLVTPDPATADTLWALDPEDLPQGVALRAVAFGVNDKPPPGAKRCEAVAFPPAIMDPRSRRRSTRQR
jgi:hypothetical protein